MLTNNAKRTANPRTTTVPITCFSLCSLPIVLYVILAIDILFHCFFHSNFKLILSN